MIFLLVAIVIVCLLGAGIWGWPLLAGALGLSSVSDKPGALKNIVQLMNAYDINPAEIETAFNSSVACVPTIEKRSKGDIAKTLFTYLGAIFILAGVGTYIGMFWDTMGSVMRVLVTLGVGYALLIVLISALHEKKFPKLILPLTLLCAVMMTGGWSVFIHEVFPHGNNWRSAMLFVFGMMTLHQAVLLYKYRLNVLAFTSLFFVYGFMHVGLDILGVDIALIAIFLGASLIIVGSALERTRYGVLTEAALLIGSIWLNGGLFERIAMLTAENWASFVIGVSVMLSAYGVQLQGRSERLTALGFFIGSIMTYAGLFDLVQHSAFELVFLGVTASILYACVVLQSRTLLLTTVLAMLSFIGYYSAEHFANSLGWPITLVVMGVGCLGVGTIAIKVKQRI